ncbi:MAG TPA: hypothetical protein GX708_24690 [Gallicola sp.]|nr:hypothetical protein [Gallicola sp.]
MLTLNSKIRLEELDGATGMEQFEKFIGKDAIVLRKEEYDSASYIVDMGGDELLINLEYDTVYDYNTNQLI